MGARAGRSRWVPLGLAAAALLISFAQRPGLDTADTKVDLHVDPVHFLSQLTSVWSPTEGLGHVQGGQYSGYLWPMGPFFALGHLLGLPDWVTERLWLGLLLALAAWGAVRLLDELLARRRGVAHLVAGAVFMVNPYVVVFTARTTIFLLAYAALPWLMLIAHRGLREPRRWWWPAAFALVVTSTGGGVNATVTALVLLGPIALVLYEWLALREAGPRDAWALTWRTVLATAVASAWWAVPLLVQSRYGLNFLQFTEQVGAIWATTSLTESLRLMGYWPSYLGQGYGAHLLPYYADSGTLLFDLPVVVASLLVPALALTSYGWTRRWRYGPFALALALLALLVMSVGYPTGTPARSGATFIYNHLSAIQFLRTTYKAGPLLALAVAVLAGAGMGALWERAGGWRAGAWRVGALVAAGALVVLAALPLFEGRALELTWRSVPAAWTQAGRYLDHHLPANSRAVVLPGQSFAFYRWGATIDPVLTATTDRPVAIRNEPPYDDLHAVDLLWTVDGLVQQQRLLPGQLRPLLNLMSARAVVTASDDEDSLSGALNAQAAAGELSSQAGLGRPARAWGPAHTFASPAQTADPPARLAQVRLYDTPARGLVRIEPAAQPTVVDGSAQGIASIAALGELPRARALFYAGDESAQAIRRQAAAGANVVITDSNRRRVFVASRMDANAGATTAAGQPFSADAAVLNPFAARGSAGQTVQVLTGVRYIDAPYNPEIAQFPAQRPYAAFDGDPRTAWEADPTLDAGRHWIEVGFDAPRAVPYIDLLPDQSDPLVRLTQVQIAGRTFSLHPGWNRLRLGLRNAGSLRIALTHVRTLGANTGSAGGLAEVRIPGVHVHELLRVPALVQDALHGADLRHTPLTYVLARTTADRPLQRGRAPSRTIVHGDRLQAEAQLIAQAQDAESGISRLVDPPAARSWTLTGLATVSPAAGDPALDRLAGTRTGGASFSSSGRLEGLPRYRASAAFDGSDTSAWVAPIAASQPAWISWTGARERSVRRLRLVRSSLPVRFPTRVSLSADGGAPETAAVGPGGALTLPAPLRGRTFRLRVLAAAGSPREAVGIAEIEGVGLPRARPAAPGRTIVSRCGQETATIGGRRVPLALRGTVATLDAGEPLRLVACGGPVALPARSLKLLAPAGAITRPLLLSLHSPAPAPLATAAAATGAVTDAGDQGNGSYTGVHVRVRAPSWLVLGESFDRGWEASCNGRSLGPPRVIDAFANGWRVGPGCRDVSITFGPQQEVDVGYLAGAAGCALLLLVLLLSRPAPPRRAAPPQRAAGPPPAASAPPEAFFRLTAVSALAVGVACALVFGFLFALRAGAVIGPVTALILWRGVQVRRLLAGAGLLLVVAVPVLYLLFGGLDQGGYDFGYASQHLGAHWVAVGAFALLALALARDLVWLRGSTPRTRRRRRA